MIDSLLRDVRYAARTFCKTPVLAAAIVVSIGLGIAANTIIFSMANAFLIRDMPVRDPDHLRIVMPGESPTSSYPEYLDFRDQTDGVFEGLAAHSPFPFPANVGTAGKPQRVWGQFVSGNWFLLTGVPVHLGRGIVPAEDETTGKDAVIVLAFSLWQRLGADRSIIGKDIVLSGARYTVVGVGAPHFWGLDRGIAAEFWIPLAMRSRFSTDIVGNESSRDNRWLEMIGRLRPNVTREQALAVLNVIHTRMAAVHEKGRVALPVIERRVGGMPIFEDGLRLLLATLSVVVVLVLLIACANVANLLLARAAARQSEISVRLAVGASRGRIVRQLLTESILLSGIGAGAGFVLSIPGTAALARLQLPLPIPIRFDFSPDMRVLGFTTGLAVVTGVLFGLAPALAGTRSLAAVRFRRARISSVLVGVQVFFSVILLLASGLFLRSLQKAASIDTGLKPEGVLMLSIDTKGQGYSAEKSKRFFRDLQRRMEATPGVESMSYMDLAPLSMLVNNTEFVDADGDSGNRALGYRYRVGPHFFNASGISFLRGRDFDPVGDENSRVAIINETMASQLFGHADPIGRHIRPRNEQAGYEVIGLVHKMKVQTVGEPDRGVVFHYLSDFSRLDPHFGATVMLRAAADPEHTADAIRRGVEALDRELPIFNVKSLSRHLDDALVLARLCGLLFGTFGVTGLVLAIIGLYAVVNISVRSRVREIGIRMSLGATPAAIASLVTRKALALVGSGLVIGMSVVLAGGSFLAGFLYGITPTDATTFAAVAAIMIVAAAVAVYFPARRASRIEPVSALRFE